MKLFDELSRDDDGPASYSEPKFNYLNRSARPAFIAIRTLLEDWFSRYPEAHRKNLYGRFRSSDDRNHQSAFFELFLHELLLRLGCRLEIHPKLVGTAKRPDFLVESDAGGSFYLEAAVATGKSQSEASTKAISRKLHDILDRIDSPNFFIGWKVEKASQDPPPARAIKAFLKQSLASLDPDQVTIDLNYRRSKTLPRWTYSHHGWMIEFFPIPKSPRIRGEAGVRTLGYEEEGPKWVDTRTPLRDVILGKAGKYGKLDVPYVVAVNSLAWHLDKVDAMEALFGKEAYVYMQTRTGFSGPKFQRNADGVWTSPTGPRYTRLSAILLIEGLLPWSLSKCLICLHKNPWTEKALQSPLDRLPRALPTSDEKLEWLDGEQLHTILGLSPGWPGID
jgi:hypothetical protein